MTHHLIGATLGALVGLIFAFAQVKILRMYSVGKSDEVRQRVYDTIDQLKLTSFFGLPLIFAIIGYMLAENWSK